MRDLRGDLADLWRTLSRTSSAAGGRVALFLGARSGDGVSSMAASFSLLAAEKSNRPVWLFDLDLARNSQLGAFEAGLLGPAAPRPGRAVDGGLGQPAFYSVTPTHAASDGRIVEPRLLALHQLGQTNLYVSAFRNDRLRPGQRVRVRTQPAYWRSVRSVVDWCVIDAPALERSGAGLVVASQVDAVILVINADDTPAEDARALKKEVEAHGGRVTGFVLNRAQRDARFLDRLLG